MMLNERAKQELQAMPRELLGKTLSLAEAAAKRDERRNSRSVKGMEDRF